VGVEALMDKYIHRGKLKGNAPLTGKDAPTIFSLVRSYRISSLPSHVSAISKAKYLTYEGATESTLAFPIFWEDEHASARLRIELIKRSDNSSQVINLTFLSPIASDVVHTINESPFLKGSTENGYLEIAPTSQYKEIRILPTAATPQVSSMTHNIMGIFHYVYMSGDGYLPDPRSFNTEGSTRSTPSRIESPTTSIASYTQLHEDRTSHGINRGLDSIAKNVEDVYNQSTKPSIRYSTAPIVLSTAHFSRGGTAFRWVLDDTRDSCSAVAVDPSLVHIELPEVVGEEIYKFTGSNGISLIRGGKRDNLDLSDILGTPEEVFGEELKVISVHTKNSVPAHSVDAQMKDHFSGGLELIRSGGRYTFNRGDVTKCSKRYLGMPWVRMDEVTIAFDYPDIPVFAADLAFGDILRIYNADGTIYYYCVDYVPSVNRVVIRSTKDQTTLDMSDGVSGLQTLPLKISMGDLGLDIIASPRSTLSSWVLLKLDRPVRVVDIEDLNGIHLRFPAASSKRTRGVFSDSKKDVNSRLLLDYNLTEWLLRLQGPVSRELTDHINSNLQALTTAQALGQSVLNMNGCLVPSSLPQLNNIHVSSYLQSEMDRNSTSSSLNTYGMPVRAFKTTRPTSGSERHPSSYFIHGILRTEHGNQWDSVSYSQVHDVRPINKLENLKFNPVTKVLHSWKPEEAPFNTTDLGRVVRIYNSSSVYTEMFQSKLYTIIEYINESRVRVRSVTPIDEYYPYYLPTATEGAFIDTACVFVGSQVAEQLAGLASLQRVDSEQGQAISEQEEDSPVMAIKRPSTAAYPHTYNIQSKADGGGSRTLKEIHSDTFNLTHVSGLIYLDETGSRILLDLGNTALGANADKALNNSIFRDTSEVIIDTNYKKVAFTGSSEIFKTLRHPKTVSVDSSLANLEGQPSYLEDLPSKYFGNMEVCVTFEGVGATNHNSAALLRDNHEIDAVSNMYRVREVTWNSAGGVQFELVSEIGGDGPIRQALGRIKEHSLPQGNFYIVGNCTFYHEVARVGGLVPRHRTSFLTADPYNADNIFSGPSKSLDFLTQAGKSVVQISTSTPYDTIGAGIGLRMMVSDLSTGLAISSESSSKSLSITRTKLHSKTISSKVSEFSDTGAEKYTNVLESLMLGSDSSLTDEGSRTFLLSKILTEMEPTASWINDNLSTRRADKYVRTALRDTLSKGALTFKDTTKMASLHIHKRLPEADELHEDLVKDGTNILMEPTVYISSSRNGASARVTDSGLVGALSLSIGEFSSNSLRNTLSNLNSFADFNLGLWGPLDLALHIIGDVKIDTGVFAIDTDTITPNNASADHYNTTHEIFHRGSLGARVMSGVGSSLVPIGDAGILPMSDNPEQSRYYGRHKVYGELDGMAQWLTLGAAEKTEDYAVWYAGNRYGQASSIYKAKTNSSFGSERPYLLPLGRTSSTQILGEVRTVSRSSITIDSLEEFFKLSARAMEPSFIGHPLLNIADSDADSSAGNDIEWDYRIPLSAANTFATETDIGRQTQTIIVIDSLLLDASIAYKEAIRSSYTKGRIHHSGASLPVKIKIYPGDSLCLVCTGVVTGKDTSYLYVKGSDFGYLFEEAYEPLQGGVFWSLITTEKQTETLNIRLTSILYGKRWDLNASAIAADCISLVSTGGDYDWVHSDPKFLLNNSGQVDEVEASSDIIDLPPFDEIVRLSSGSSGSFFRSDLRVEAGSLISLDNTDLKHTKLRGDTHLSHIYPLKLQKLLINSNVDTPVVESLWDPSLGSWLEAKKPTLYELLDDIVDPTGDGELYGASVGERSSALIFDDVLQPVRPTRYDADTRRIYSRNLQYGIQAKDYLMTPALAADWIHTSTQVVVKHPEDVKVLTQNGVWGGIGGIVTKAGLVEFDLSKEGGIHANNILAFRMSKNAHGFSTTTYDEGGGASYNSETSSVECALMVREKQTLVSGVSYVDSTPTTYKYHLNFKYKDSDLTGSPEDNITWLLNPIVEQYGRPHRVYGNKMADLGSPRKAHGYDLTYLASWTTDDSQDEIVDYPSRGTRMTQRDSLLIPSHILSSMLRIAGDGSGALYYDLLEFLGISNDGETFYSDSGRNSRIQDLLGGPLNYDKVPINLIGEYSFVVGGADNRGGNPKKIKEEVANYIYSHAAQATPTKYQVKIPAPTFKWVGRHVTITIPPFHEGTQFNPFLGAWSRKRRVMNPSEWVLLWGNSGGDFERPSETDLYKLLSIPHLRHVASFNDSGVFNIPRNVYRITGSIASSSAFGAYTSSDTVSKLTLNGWHSSGSLFFRGMGLDILGGSVGRRQTHEDVGDGQLGHMLHGDNWDSPGLGPTSVKMHDCDVLIYTAKTNRTVINNNFKASGLGGADLVGTYDVTDLKSGFSKTFTAVRIPSSDDYKWVEIHV
jgi:hypothetical protein